MNFKSVVVKGAGQGRKLGFPTINLEMPEEFSLKEGVYSAYVKTPLGEFKGGLHFGPKKTLSPDEKSLEIHLIGFEGDLLGREVSVSVKDFIRPLKKFSGPKELVDQIRKDIKSI